jgi:hypothetical protein
MCRAALTSNENSTQAAAVNDELFIWWFPICLLQELGMPFTEKRRNQVSFLKFISIHQRIHRVPFILRKAMIAWFVNWIFKLNSSIFPFTKHLHRRIVF